jgi:2-oxoisovalerate dehydrogenase E1 component
VLFLEHKHLYRQTYNKGEYPGSEYMIPFGKAATKREGTDVAVITWGALVQRSILAAQQAEKAGISTMVIDLRTIMPYDWDAIAAAVKHTNRIVIAHEDQITCGFGAEIAARVPAICSNTSTHPSAASARWTCRRLLPRSRRSHLPGSADVLRAIQGDGGVLITDVRRYTP